MWIALYTRSNRFSLHLRVKMIRWVFVCSFPLLFSVERVEPLRPPVLPVRTEKNVPARIRYAFQFKFVCVRVAQLSADLVIKFFRFRSCLYTTVTKQLNCDFGFDLGKMFKLTWASALALFRLNNSLGFCLILAFQLLIWLWFHTPASNSSPFYCFIFVFFCL